MARLGARLADRLAAEVRRNGPLRFDHFQEACLYDPEEGFFVQRQGSGRAGADFITSPEVGGLFGLLVSRALDGWWEELGRPDPFFVVEVGAGRGRLAADVLRSAPACAKALRYILVERSPALRLAQRDLLVLEPAGEVLGPAGFADPGEAPVPLPGKGPILASLAELPAARLVGVVLANELLDNLPIRLVERHAGGWLEVRVGIEEASGSTNIEFAHAEFVEILVPADPELAGAADLVGSAVPTLSTGDRLPIQVGSAAFLSDCAGLLRKGFVALIDYADVAAGLIARGQASWLRTYRAHRVGSGPLADPGSQDVTCEVVLEWVRRSASAAGLALMDDLSQADWLETLGICGLVEEAKDDWRPGRLDLPALAARSRILEAQALCDAGGLGAHRVLILGRGISGERPMEKRGASR
ncbi:MAG: SAM-dependent methyltransferase [Acidimicrobiia bacterium]